ncbi:hypothetical protein U0035_14190 [Niabella yanshanensis]|uniref:Translation elongation factor EFTu/EF1A C-terminal domain-containing protein n=1 Tax=Niabella yanshanensis TaxID=577386 RepID=A0ABZ0W0N1_9BACT|nr:hypothetical protein [Niabella yanshanensis]WQD36818.1 hypothetical protein U0035_14190 [Niabella yanshanensis]
MNDWDTEGQINIAEFIKETKDFFGTPLTPNKINSKPVNLSDGSAWKYEAGSSLVEMIRLSQQVYQQSDFDQIIENIIGYYQVQLEKIDFLADLKYLDTSEGGRKTPAFSKYRPQIKFGFDDMQTSGEQTFINKTVVNPGEEVEASIRIIAVDHFKNRLQEGMAFEFREGPRIIGTGAIVQLLNEKLRKPADD